MGLHLATGTITRALPGANGLDVKLQRGDGTTRDLHAPDHRADIVGAARSARLSGSGVSLRHTDDGMIVSLTIGTMSIAA